MRSAPCSRLFEVEAARDGRLTGPELVGFERHLTACAVCRREATALEGLANGLRAGAPGDEDMLHVRRERTRLLAAFDRTLVAPEHRAGAPRPLLWAAAMATFLASSVVLWEMRPGGPRVHAGADVQADGAAVWSERMEGGREKIVLERGQLRIHVDHSSDRARLLVALPDGELEDTGTTFTVIAEDGRTTRVAVQEGHVVLRIRGEPTVALGAGDAWTPKPRSTASGAASAVSPVDTGPAARSAAVGQTPAPPPAAPLAAPNASVDFRTAMAAFDVGDDHQAAAAFASFLEKHPRDPRAEDAAYLHVIALQRSGDKAGMKQAALEYLHRFPAGFRQAEVEPLAREARSP